MNKGYYILLLCLITALLNIFDKKVYAQEVSFDLQDGDRVVLLGNSLIENDQKHGYIEFVLTSRWPDREIIFRNLGWTGDTVYGDARSYYTTPPDSYDLLIQQIKDVQPTVVFIGYGGNESHEGENGLSKFEQGLHNLIDEIEELGAETVLLSTVPRTTGSNKKQLSRRNEKLELYSSTISKIASERDKIFIDLFNPLLEYSKQFKITTDGLHLNEVGYYLIASIIESELDLLSRNWDVEINAKNGSIKSTGAVAVLDNNINGGRIEFTIKDKYLPIPTPIGSSPLDNYKRRIRIKGLDDGYYTLKLEEDNLKTASAERWEEGIAMKGYDQSKELLDQINQKNLLYLHKYRPHNRTYLIGFRSYEQGQNVKELDQQDLFISRIEDRIFQLHNPKPAALRVNAVK